MTNIGERHCKYKSPVSDLWGSPEHCKADNVCEQLEKAWELEKRKQKPSFGYALFSANKSWLLINCSSQLVIMVLRIGGIESNMFPRDCHLTVCCGHNQI